MFPTRAILDWAIRCRRAWPIAAVPVSVVTLVAIAAGCNEVKHYETLTFFFDGVPEPGRETPVAVKPGKREGMPTGARDIQPAVQTEWIHEPYRERKCDGCHSKMFARDLARPKQELCDSCHPGMRNVAHVHGPVAAGACMGCHHPHRSPNPYLLVAPAQDLCMKCHGDTFTAQADYHAGWNERQCVACHNAHVTTIKVQTVESTDTGEDASTEPSQTAPPANEPKANDAETEQADAVRKQESSVEREKQWLPPRRKNYESVRP